ncbi:MAG: 2-oxo acid dehydrogenase subunit E2 [Myxococcales bacterium]|nr:2-oxo acid dehydrogenase subunit E2 [Myxococcales bacterium]MCB9582857.1 2-oxo acid dehydrogenase subunit E2 [Polyangiaceae bacterium]
MQFSTLQPLPTWRKIALSSWRASDSPTIYGWMDIDVTALQAHLARLRKTTGARVTLTHAVGKAAATAFAAHPECNAIVSLGRLLQRRSVDVFFSVAVGDGKNLSGSKLSNVDRLTLPEIATGLDEQVAHIRKRKDTPLQRSQSKLERFPGFTLGPIMRATAALSFDLGMNLEPIGVPRDPFGTVIVTNVGVLGVEQGFAPLIPAGRTPALLTLGAVREKVIAVDGRPQVRPVLTLCGTFDHRVVDGAHLGKISTTLRRLLENPDATPNPQANLDPQSTPNPQATLDAQATPNPQATLDAQATQHSS